MANNYKKLKPKKRGKDPSTVISRHEGGRDRTKGKKSNWIYTREGVNQRGAQCATGQVWDQKLKKCRKK